jgi:microcystin-dependent protein
MGTGGGLQTYSLAESGGVESVTLTTQQIPIHTHPALCSSGGGSPSSDPAGGTWAPSDVNQYGSGTTGFMGSSAILTTGAGGSQPHDNLIPYLCVNYIISMFGIFPTQT